MTKFLSCAVVVGLIFQRVCQGAGRQQRRHQRFGRVARTCPQ